MAGDAQAAGAASLVLDFDGVICDSRRECMITSYNAIAALEAGPGPVPPFTTRLPEDEAQLFMEYRFLVRVAKEYLLLWQAIRAGQALSKGRPLPEQVSAPEEQLQRFEGEFFRQRSAWRGLDQSQWLDHNPLYDGVMPHMRRWLEQGRLYICSSKDEDSILTILAHHGLPIPPELVYGFGQGDKVSSLWRIAGLSGGRALLFVDDHLGNLRLARGAGVEAIMASWGYSSAENRAQAREEGFRVIGLTQLAELD